MTSTRLTKANKQLYLNFLMTTEIQQLLDQIPRSCHLNFLRTEFLKRFSIKISEPTQSRFRKLIEAGKLINKDGKFYLDWIRYRVKFCWIKRKEKKALGRCKVLRELLDLAIKLCRDIISEGLGSILAFIKIQIFEKIYVRTFTISWLWFSPIYFCKKYIWVLNQILNKFYWTGLLRKFSFSKMKKWYTRFEPRDHSQTRLMISGYAKPVYNICIMEYYLTKNYFCPN
jgi:hypothetical protein